MSSRQTLPSFKYHPEPLASGSLRISKKKCEACGRARGYIYTGPSYCTAGLDDALCPWCIANGRANRRFGAEFTEFEKTAKKQISRSTVRGVTRRTPGFSGWQQERWLVHCGDACEFLGPAGKKELRAYRDQQLIESLQRDCKMKGDDWKAHFKAMERDQGPVTAYVFRCRSCRVLLGYSDCL